MNKYIFATMVFVVSIFTMTMNPSFCSARDLQWVYSNNTTRYEVDMDSLNIVSDHELEIIIVASRPEKQDVNVQYAHIDNVQHTYSLLFGCYVDSEGYEHKYRNQGPFYYNPRSPIDRIVYFVQQKQLGKKAAAT